MKTYEEQIAELYNRFPMYQQIGAGAYKPGLQNAECLDRYFGHPHRQFKSIHIAGTNGKGSTSHLLAAILACSGYKTGLYTSPHLIDFRERIKVDGEMIPRERVLAFLSQHADAAFSFRPSFFELTTFMAFDYFASQQIDVAVIEVGLGGRLDTTNVITPELSIITNISLDHVQMLGHDLPSIAREKAGIIKPHVPVVIGEATDETKNVFDEKARSCNAPILYAEERNCYAQAEASHKGWLYKETLAGDVWGELGGEYQKKNTATVLTAIEILREEGFTITDEAIKEGFAHVTSLTGLQGRWQIVSASPTVICDTGHNVGGWKYLSEQLKRVDCHSKRIVFGMVNDKDIDGVLELLPKDAVYCFTKANTKRALSEIELQKMAIRHGLVGNTYPTVKQAYEEAKQSASQADLIFVGGSSYVVADFLCAFV